jgi:hypothetical protein
MNLARGAARGAVWNFATVLVERGFGFVILGLLLRVIPAPVVGLIAIASALSDLAGVVASSGAGEQVQASPGDRNVEAGAFWSQFLASLLCMGVLFAAAPAIAGLYGQPELALVLRVMALNVVMTCFLIVPSARLASQFRFKAVGLISLGSTVSGGLVALPLAFTGHGIAALVWQRMVGVGFYALVAAIVARWAPPRLPSLAVLREGFRFSWPLMQAAFVDYIAVTGYVMLVGLRMSVADLGRFRIAQRLAEVLQEIAFMPARKVFMPVFVAVRHDADRRYETTRQMLDLLAMVIFFVSAVCGGGGTADCAADVRREMGGGGAGVRHYHAHDPGGGAVQRYQPAAGGGGAHPADLTLCLAECRHHCRRRVVWRALWAECAGLGAGRARGGGFWAVRAGAAPRAGAPGGASFAPAGAALLSTGGGAAGRIRGAGGVAGA